MKRIFNLFLAFSLGIALIGCAKEYDDTTIKSDVKTIKDQITKIQDDIRSINSQIAGLTSTIEEWKKGGYVQSIQELPDKTGYTITFVGGKTVTLYHGTNGKNGTNGENGQTGPAGPTGKTGNDGKTPSLKLDTDNNYYWTIDGEFILVDGAKVPATVVPVFSVNANGDLIMTIGSKETNLGHVKGEDGISGKLFEVPIGTGSSSTNRSGFTPPKIITRIRGCCICSSIIQGWIKKLVN